jgi:hypothetical protein
VTGTRTLLPAVQFSHSLYPAGSLLTPRKTHISCRRTHKSSDISCNR